MTPKIHIFQLLVITDNKPVIHVFPDKQAANDEFMKQAKAHWEKYNTDPHLIWQNVLNTINTEGEYQSSMFTLAPDGTGYKNSTFTMTADGGDSTMSDQHISWYLNHMILTEQEDGATHVCESSPDN